MVMTPPRQQGRRRRLKLELALLNAKEKLFGTLSDRERQRKNEILHELSITY